MLHASLQALRAQCEHLNQGRLWQAFYAQSEAYNALVIPSFSAQAKQRTPSEEGARLAPFLMERPPEKVKRLAVTEKVKRLNKPRAYPSPLPQSPPAFQVPRRSASVEEDQVVLLITQLAEDQVLPTRALACLTNFLEDAKAREGRIHGAVLRLKVGHGIALEKIVTHAKTHLAGYLRGESALHADTKIVNDYQTLAALEAQSALQKLKSTIVRAVLKYLDVLLSLHVASQQATHLNGAGEAGAEASKIAALIAEKAAFFKGPRDDC